MLDREQIKNWKGGNSPLSPHYYKVLSDSLSLFISNTKLTYHEEMAIKRAADIINQHKN